MPISPELQAKIDALEDEGLKARILDVLTGPGTKLATNEEIFESMTSSHTLAREQQARLRKWQDDEVIAFAQHVKEKSPEDYFEFLRQEKQFNEIEEVLAWSVYRLIWEWLPDLSSADTRTLFGKFRDYAKSHST